jgi:hypothetical protein
MRRADKLSGNYFQTKKTIQVIIAMIFLFFSARLSAQPAVGIAGSGAFSTMTNVNTPVVAEGAYAIPGFAPDQTLVGLNARTSNGDLYALGYDQVTMMGQLYRVANFGGGYTADAVGPAISLNQDATENAASDFVPTADNEVRIIGRNGNDYLFDANTGALLGLSAAGSTGFVVAAPAADVNAGNAAIAERIIEAGTNYTATSLPVYPNPVSSSTRIALPQPSVSTVYVRIIDLNGVVQRSYQYPAGISVLDVDMSRLRMGLYSVRVSGKDIGFYNLKVVKD